MRLTWKLASVLLLLAWGLYAGRFWIGEPPVIGASADDSIYLAVAMNLNHPQAFTRDWGVRANTAVVGPIAWTRLLALCLRFTDDVSRLRLALSSMLLLLFVTGAFVLVLRWSGEPAVALVAAVVSLRPRLGFITEWGVVLPHALPRTLVMALTAWVIWGTWQSRARFPMLALWSGLLSVAHPITGLHLFLLSAVQHVLLAARSRRALGHLLLGGALFALGGLPTLLTAVSLVVDRPAPDWFLRFRTPYLFFQPRQLLGTLIYDLGPPLLLMAWCWSRARAGLAPEALRWTRMGMAAVAVWTAAWLASLPGLAFFQLWLGRMSAFVHLFALLIVVGAAWGLWKREALSARAHAMVLVGLLAICSGAGWDAGLDRAQAWLGSPVGPRSSWLRWGETPEPVPPIAVDAPELDLRAFRELVRWAGERTPAGRRFLTPPSAFAAFRIYARRAITLSVKDAGVLIFSRAAAEEWYGRFRAVAGAYASPGGSGLEPLARRLGAEYVVVPRSGPRLSLPVAFENGAHRVYQVARAA